MLSTALSHHSDLDIKIIIFRSSSQSNLIQALNCRDYEDFVAKLSSLCVFSRINHPLRDPVNRGNATVNSLSSREARRVKSKWEAKTINAERIFRFVRSSWMQILVYHLRFAVSQKKKQQQKIRSIRLRRKFASNNLL